MSAELRPRAGILDISPYVPGRSSDADGRQLIKLSANESALGASPRAVKAFLSARRDLFLYPDGDSAELRGAIASHYGLAAERIVCGCGSDELLHLLCIAFAGPGDEVIFTEHGFSVYAIATRVAGASPVIAHEKNLHTDVDAILAAVTPRTRLVFIANPNNPTGTYIPLDEVRRLHRGLPANVLLVLDAAYAEFVNHNDYDDGTAIAHTAENVVVTHTFSKIFGLAALRVGWLYGSPTVVDAVNRVRGPFSVSIPAQRAAAAALQDVAFLDRARAHNVRWLGWITRQLRAMGLETTPSVCNFVLIHFPDGPKNADAADKFLASRGYAARRVGSYNLPAHLRLTVGKAADNRAAIAALRDFMAA